MSTVDPVVEEVRADLHRRSQLGIAKYGTTLAGSGLSQAQLLQHLYEELLDGANYIKAEQMRASVAAPASGDPETSGIDIQRSEDGFDIRFIVSGAVVGAMPATPDTLLAFAEQMRGLALSAGARPAE